MRKKKFGVLLVNLIRKVLKLGEGLIMFVVVFFFCFYLCSSFVEVIEVLLGDFCFFIIKRYYWRYGGIFLGNWVVVCGS